MLSPAFSAAALRLRSLGKLVLSASFSVTKSIDGNMNSTIKMEASVPMPSKMPNCATTPEAAIPKAKPVIVRMLPEVMMVENTAFSDSAIAV